MIIQNQNMLSLENGHWLIGEKYQNVGGFKSVRADLDDVPTEGWLYNDGTKWNDSFIEGTTDEISQTRISDTVSGVEELHRLEQVIIESTEERDSFTSYQELQDRLSNLLEHFKWNRDREDDDDIQADFF